MDREDAPWEMNEACSVMTHFIASTANTNRSWVLKEGGGVSSVDLVALAGARTVPMYKS